MKNRTGSIRVVDTTLNEGYQLLGNHFSNEQLIEIATELASIGIDMIECGRPSRSKKEMERIRNLSKLNLSCPLLSLATTRQMNIKAVVDSGSSWVGISLGSNTIDQQAHFFNITLSEVIDNLVGSIVYAHDCGLRVRCDLEVAYRRYYPVIFKALEASLNIDADRICLIDRKGILEPNDVITNVRLLKKEFPTIELEVHMYNDRGLALANTLSAIDSGVQWVYASINGLGKRAGVTDLFLLLANLHYRKQRELLYGSRLRCLSIKIAAYSRSSIDSRHPVIGSDVFVQSEDRHEITTDFWISPELLGVRNFKKVLKLTYNPKDLLVKPKIISSNELHFHKEGPGFRYVMMDDRAVPDCRQYCIVRNIPIVSSNIASHVEVHSHVVDSLYLFLGYESGLHGLRVEVQLHNTRIEIESPAAVFIPSGMLHTYRVLEGRGIFINHVLRGNYNGSLLHTNMRLEKTITKKENGRV